MTNERLKTAEDALETLMADAILANTLPYKVTRKIDRWRATQLAELQNSRGEEDRRQKLATSIVDSLGGSDVDFQKGLRKTWIRLVAEQLR